MQAIVSETEEKIPQTETSASGESQSVEKNARANEVMKLNNTKS